MRTWRALADPPGSPEAFLIARFALPIGAVCVATWYGLGLHGIQPVTLGDVAWTFALLWVVRQRDQARAEARRHREGHR
ncbi:hypothetical protein ACIBQ6_22065 [Nonomuraea sp. NPDC049655]|uniref:hypothetical protein n=1 Tax=Nonomuraea sp. NPDC049655 TaxID=3364355 RepID=UPI00378F6DBD